MTVFHHNSYITECKPVTMTAITICSYEAPSIKITYGRVMSGVVWYGINEDGAC